MTYQITVPQMHCTGCDALMNLTLEDDFQNIQADHMSRIVKFESDKNIDEVKLILDKLFEEFKGKEAEYTYQDLALI